MPTTQKTQQQASFAPTGMAAYNQLQNPFASTTQGYIQNPFSNPFFQTQQQLGTRQAQNLGGTNISNLLHNFGTSGTGGASGTLAPFQQEMLQNQARANTGLQSQLGFLNPVMNALGLQQNALGMAAGYRPLQTGGTTTQSTQGLGTWLPQVANLGLGLATGGLGGGLFGGVGRGMPTGGTPGMQDTAMSSFNQANPSSPSFLGGGAFGEGASGYYGGAPPWMSGGMAGPYGGIPTGGATPPPPPQP